MALIPERPIIAPYAKEGFGRWKSGLPVINRIDDYDLLALVTK